MEKCPFADSGLPNPHTSASMDAVEPTSTIDEAKTKSENETNTSSNEAMNEDAKLVDNDSPSQGRCPWPFIFFHDPKTGMTDWQTWVVLGLVVCFAWNKIQKFL